MSDYWANKYKISDPDALKYLKANGEVVDENGNVLSEANDYWKKTYQEAEPKVAKYLHADGTIDENPGSGGGDLEDNHETTIDVSTYTEPVEIAPTAGKDGMKKATVTLSNIPSGGGIKPLEFDSSVAIYDDTYKYLRDAEGHGTSISGFISDWANVKGFIFVTEDKSEVATLDKITNKISATYDDSNPSHSANNNTGKIATHIIMKHPDSELLRFVVMNGIYGERNISEYFNVRVTSDGAYTIETPRHPKEDSDSETNIDWSVFKIYGVYLIY